MTALAFNRYGVWAVYKFEMARAIRTIWQSLVTPVITTSLYFVVFGGAIGSRLTHVGGVSYGAFIVPWNHQTLWGSEEAEIAQWGEVKAADIVGFTELGNYNPKGGPIFVRRSFRKAEPAAFEYMFNVISGKTP